MEQLINKKGEYLFSDFILLFMFLRLYILVRNIFNHSKFSDPYAKMHCDQYGFTANSRFVLKWYLVRYPGLTVWICLFSSILVFSYLMRIVERPFSLINDRMNEPFFNNIYFIITTITTVGYGDFVPVTTLGKALFIITAFYGGFIISLLIVSVEGIFSLSTKQETAYRKLTMVKTAANWIVAAMRLRVLQVRFQRDIELEK